MTNAEKIGMPVYKIGDLVLVDPTTDYKYAGKIMQITRVKRTPYGVSYAVAFPNDPWERSTYKEQYLFPISTTTSMTAIKPNKQEDKEMESFKKMVKAQEIHNNGNGVTGATYDLALYGYDNEDTSELKDKLIVARIINRGFLLMKVVEVQDNDDVTARTPGEVIDVVDTTDYDIRVANRTKKAELRKKMDAVIASKSVLQTYQKYAELFPDVAELFNEYKEL